MKKCFCQQDHCCHPRPYMHFVVRECFYIEIIKNWYILQSASAVLQQVS